MDGVPDDDFSPDVLDLVELHGLNSTALNGSRGSIFDTFLTIRADGRMGVMLEDGKPRCVKLGNIRPLAAADAVDAEKLEALRALARRLPGIANVPPDRKKQVVSAVTAARHALSTAALALLDGHNYGEAAAAGAAACERARSEAAGPAEAQPAAPLSYDADAWGEDRGVPGWRMGCGTCTDPDIAGGFAWPPMPLLRNTAWQWIVMFGEAAVPELLRRGVSPHHLLCAACCVPGSERVVRQLLREHPAEVRQRIDLPCAHELYGASGQPALHYAAHSRSLRLVSLLLEEGGADVNVRHTALPEHNNGGSTALWKAAERGAAHIVRRLLLAGAKMGLGKTEPHDNMPLHMAAQNGHESVALELLRAGCCPDVFNARQLPPFMSARAANNINVEALLAKYGSIWVGATAKSTIYGEAGRIKLSDSAFMEHAANLPLQKLGTVEQARMLLGPSQADTETAMLDTPDMQCMHAVFGFQRALAAAYGSTDTWASILPADERPRPPFLGPEACRAQVERALELALRELDIVARKAQARGPTAAALRCLLHVLYCRSAVFELAGAQYVPAALRACVDALQLAKDHPEVLREGDGAEVCPICLEALRQPQCLPCGHRFCRPCVAQLRRDGPRTYNDAGDAVQVCPSCRAAIPGGYEAATDDTAGAAPAAAAAAAAGGGSSNADGGTHCDHCGTPGARLRCAKCKTVWYCTRDCQRAAWKSHKKTCAQQATAFAEALEKVEGLTPRGLREALDEFGVAHAQCIEKEEFRALLRDAVQQNGGFREPGSAARQGGAVAAGSGGGPGGVKAAAAMVHILTSFDLPRLMSAAHGPTGSDRRVVLCRRRRPLVGEALPPAVTHSSWVTFEKVAYRFGGKELSRDIVSASAKKAVASVWAFDPAIAELAAGAARGAPWREVQCAGTPPPECWGHSAVCTTDGKMVVFGGSTGRKAKNSLYALDLRATPPRWESLAVRGGAKPSPRGGHAACIAGDGSMYISCGEGQPFELHDDVWRLDLHSLKWKRVATSGALPRARLEHAMWFEPPSSNEGESLGSLLIYGGQIFPGRDLGRSYHEAGFGVQSEGGAVHALELATGVWHARAVLGQGPGRLQEMGVLTMAPTEKGNGAPAVVLWGGFMERQGLRHDEIQKMCGAQAALAEELFEHPNTNEVGAPYTRNIFVYEDRVWRALRPIGDDSALMAQACLVQTSQHAFCVVGGYGLVADSEAEENPEMAAFGRMAGMSEEQAKATSIGTTPECMVASYSCTLHNAEEAGSDACYGTASHFQFVEQYDGSKKRDPAVLVVWQTKHCSGVGVQVCSDKYRGPIEPQLRARLEAEGWNAEQGSMASMMAEPDAKGANFEPSTGIVRNLSAVRKGKLGEAYKAFEAAKGKNDAEHDAPVAFYDWSAEVKSARAPRAAAYAAELHDDFSRRRAATPSDVPAHLTLRVKVVGIVPEIWRLLRVTPTLTLNELADQVLCPVFGYTRNYHSHAFQQCDGAKAGLIDCERAAGDQDTAPPWLGPVKCTALDMAHVPFFVGALGDDRLVPVGAMLRKIGDGLRFVSDLGDWWEHRISVVAVGGEEVLGAAAEVLDGALAGPPQDVEGPAMFCQKLNVLLGLESSSEVKIALNNEPQVISPDSKEWWSHLNAQFRNHNSSAVAYAPMHFDLPAARARVSTALRGQRSRAADAASFMTVVPASLHGGVAGSKGMNERVGRAGGAGAACAVCHATAGLSVCSGCNTVWYCCREHQSEDWKAHKRECKRLAAEAASAAGGGGAKASKGKKKR